MKYCYHVYGEVKTFFQTVDYSGIVTSDTKICSDVDFKHLEEQIVSTCIEVKGLSQDTNARCLIKSMTFLHEIED